MRCHAVHAIATVDVAFDLIDDATVASDTAVVLLSMILGHLPPSQREQLGAYLVDHAIMLLEHVEA